MLFLSETGALFVICGWLSVRRRCDVDADGRKHGRVQGDLKTRGESPSRLGSVGWKDNLSAVVI